MSLEIIKETVIEENKDIFLSSCQDNTLIDYVASDFEIPFPKGYSIQFSASKPCSFAKPYPPCNVAPLTEFTEKQEFEFDFSFMGDVRLPFRFLLFKKIKNYALYHQDHRYKFVLNPKGFYMFSEEEKKYHNQSIEYEKSLTNSRFCLCPRGAGLQSIRFFESLAVNTIPIYIGPRETKMPLDWLIDWDKACLRIESRFVIDGSFQVLLDNYMKMSLKEINDRRKYIFDIFNNYFIDSDVFQKEVYEKVEKDFLESKNS